MLYMLLYISWIKFVLSSKELPNYYNLDCTDSDIVYNDYIFFKCDFCTNYTYLNFELVDSFNYSIFTFNYDVYFYNFYWIYEKFAFCSSWTFVRFSMPSLISYFLAYTSTYICSLSSLYTTSILSVLTQTELSM